MPDQYRTTSTSAQTFEVERLDDDGNYQRDIILEESTTTRKVMRALIVRNSANPNQRCKVTIVHQRKPNGGNEWEDVESINLNRLTGGEGVKFDLSSTATFQLYEQLRNVFEVAESGEYGYGEHDLVVGRVEEMVRVERSRAAMIRQLIEAGHSEEVWRDLVSDDPDLATRLANSRVQEDRVRALSQFELMMQSNHSELEWQTFFENNQWIFGYGLKYVFLQQVQSQPNYGGTNVTGSGGQRGDYLTASVADIQFTVLVEIKKPNTSIVLEEMNRSGCNRLSSDLLDGVNQIQVNCSKWEQSSRLEENQEILRDEGIFTVKPKGILIIGHTSQLNSHTKRAAFENFRSNLSSPEIITFDELYSRARFIVETDTDTNSDSEVSDDVPF